MAWDDFTAEVGYAMLPRLEGVDWGQHGFVDGMDVEGRETSEGIAAAGVPPSLKDRATGIKVCLRRPPPKRSASSSKGTHPSRG